jgi:MFS family permease
MAENINKTSITDYTPILTFVISFFIFHMFDWQDATHFTLAVFVSLATYMVELHFLKDDKVVNKKNIKTTSFHTGILTFFALLVFAAGSLHWYRLIPITGRTILLLLAVVIYLAVLFYAIRTLIYIKAISEEKK